MELINKENILHIFITPNLTGEQLFMNQLNITNKSAFLPGSIYSTRHLLEGKKITFPSLNESDQAGSNLECICEHPKTEKYFPPRKYKNLGNDNLFETNIFRF